MVLFRGKNILIFIILHTYVDSKWLNVMLMSHAIFAELHSALIWKALKN